MRRQDNPSNGGIGGNGGNADGRMTGGGDIGGDINVTTARRPRKPAGNGVSILDEMVAETPDLLARLDAPPPTDAPVPTLPISDIAPDPRQPRRHIRQSTLDALAADIARVGVLQPLVVRPAPDWNGYLIVFGERRYRAALMAGLTHIPAFIRRDLTDVDVLELQWQENAQREDVDDIDKALHLRRMKEARGLSWSQMADTVHLSRRHLLRMQQLAEMPEGVIAKVRSRDLTPSHVYQLARVTGADDRTRLADAAAAGRWSVMALSRRVDEATITVDITGEDADAASRADAGSSATSSPFDDNEAISTPTRSPVPASPAAMDRIDLTGLSSVMALERLAQALSSRLESVATDNALTDKERSRAAAITAKVARAARIARERLKAAPPRDE